MPRFFTNCGGAAAGGVIEITGSDARHIALALRMRVGDGVTVCDFSRREYSCVLEEITPELVLARVVSEKDSDTEPPYVAVVYQALPKGERADFIVQKSVECGASGIVFFAGERCVAKLDRKGAEGKLARWRRIASEAAKQCGRGIIPDVRYIGSFDDAIGEASEGELCFMCYEGGEEGEHPTEKLGVMLGRFDGERGGIPRDIRFLIGPEGGFGHSEVQRAVDAGFMLAGLGPRILRCETAPPFVLACLSMRYELT